MDARVFKILIVDDNLKNLQITGKVLRDEGYQISVASSGANAIMQVAEFKPDLILLDIMMPEMDGFEVMEKLKAAELTAYIPVIYLTARNQTEDLVSAFKSGGVDFINKPFVKEELLARVRTHVELYESRRRIIDMNQTRDKLYAVIAHDIRAPFSAIIQTLELFNENAELSKAEFNRLLGMLYERSIKTYDLLTNLLDWTRVKSGKINLRKVSLSISDLVDYNVVLLSQAAEMKQIDITNTIDPTIKINIDENSLSTIIRNLINNAIKFTPNGGKILISVDLDHEFVTINVSDTGVGMSPKSIRKIFSENKHLSTYGTDNEPGTGLGLFLVKDLVFINQGLVEVKSEIGVGTTFSLCFPV